MLPPWLTHTHTLRRMRDAAPLAHIHTLRRMRDPVPSHSPTEDIQTLSHTPLTR